MRARGDQRLAPITEGDEFPAMQRSQKRTGGNGQKEKTGAFHRVTNSSGAELTRFDEGRVAGPSEELRNRTSLQQRKINPSTRTKSYI